MSEVASRQLRNHTRELLQRVQEGEEVTITVSGRPVAVLHPLKPKSSWVPRREFVQRVITNQADGKLTQELRELSPETTDDLASA